MPAATRRRDGHSSLHFSSLALPNSKQLKSPPSQTTHQGSKNVCIACPSPACPAPVLLHEDEDRSSCVLARHVARWDCFSSFELQLGSVLVRACWHCFKLCHTARTVWRGDEMCHTISSGSYNRNLRSLRCLKHGVTSTWIRLLLLFVTFYCNENCCGFLLRRVSGGCNIAC